MEYGKLHHSYHNGSGLKFYIKCLKWKKFERYFIIPRFLFAFMIFFIEMFSKRDAWIKYKT